MRTTKRLALWNSVSDSDWHDWQWQQRHRVTSVVDLQKIITLDADEVAGISAAIETFPMAITPYYASLMDPENPRDPIRLQCVPTDKEGEHVPGDESDPLAEEHYMPVEGLTHRYPDRALFYTTHNCPVYCRHCNRRRKVGDSQSAPDRAQLAQAIDYLAQHSEIRDVLVSGGDPLSYVDAKLEELLSLLRNIPHIEILRIATRNPVTLPQRITPELVAMLRRYQPIFVNTHFNHLQECTTEAAQALELLADAGCVLGNQMVLLKGINEDPVMVRKMNQWLLKHRCRPYYMFQCDAVAGTAHFRTPLEKGLTILSNLQGWTSGLAVPHYVVDLPGGGGKVPLTPEYHLNRNRLEHTFRSYRGLPIVYREGE